MERNVCWWKKKKFQDAYEKEKLSKTQNSSMEGSDSE